MTHKVSITMLSVNIYKNGLYGGSNMRLYHWYECKLEELQKYFDHPNPINCRNGYSDVGDRLKILMTSLKCLFVTNIINYFISNIDVANRKYPMKKDHCEECESIVIECIKNCENSVCMSTCNRDYATCIENCS